jgi:hypothetical protein
MKILNMALIGAIVALTGCAASGPKFAEMQASTPTLNADQGRVFFYRKGSMFGAAIQPALKLDGKEVGKSQPGGYFYVDAASGSHEASASTEATNKVSFVLAKGEVKYVRTSPQMGLLAGHIVPELVGADEATKELSDLSYTGNTK